MKKELYIPTTEQVSDMVEIERTNHLFNLFGREESAAKLAVNAIIEFGFNANHLGYLALIDNSCDLLMVALGAGATFSGMMKFADDKMPCIDGEYLLTWIKDQDLFELMVRELKQYEQEKLIALKVEQQNNATANNLDNSTLKQEEEDEDEDDILGGHVEETYEAEQISLLKAQLHQEYILGQDSYSNVAADYSTME